MKSVKIVSAAFVVIAGFIFATPAVEKTTPPTGAKAPMILVQSSCRSSVLNPGTYSFALNSVTEAYYNTLYFNFCNPTTGTVIYSIPNSQPGPRSVKPPVAGNYRVIITTSPITKVNYMSGCGYSSLIPGGVSASPLMCSFTDCDAQ